MESGDLQLLDGPTTNGPGPGSEPRTRDYARAEMELPASAGAPAIYDPGYGDAPATAGTAAEQPAGYHQALTHCRPRYDERGQVETFCVPGIPEPGHADAAGDLGTGYRSADECRAACHSSLFPQAGEWVTGRTPLASYSAYDSSCVGCHAKTAGDGVAPAPLTGRCWLSVVTGREAGAAQLPRTVCASLLLDSERNPAVFFLEPASGSLGAGLRYGDQVTVRFLGAGQLAAGPKGQLVFAERGDQWVLETAEQPAPGKPVRVGDAVRLRRAGESAGYCAAGAAEANSTSARPGEPASPPGCWLSLDASNPLTTVWVLSSQPVFHAEAEEPLRRAAEASDEQASPRAAAGQPPRPGADPPAATTPLGFLAIMVLFFVVIVALTVVALRRPKRPATGLPASASGAELSPLQAPAASLEGSVAAAAAAPSASDLGPLAVSAAPPAVPDLQSVGGGTGLLDEMELRRLISMSDGL